MKKFLELISSHLFPIGLTLLCLMIMVVNHVPGTYLSGWDTLHPEFNFGLSLQRILNGAFRYEQGVGAVAAHSHMSELPRVIWLMLTSLVIPNDLLRYSYVGLCLILGVLGVYYFLKQIIFKDLALGRASAYALIGSLFYLFNLGTLQHFYFPFEMFQTQYAFLPWIFLVTARYLEQPTRKRLFWFGLVNFFATPMAFASTLWFAYFGGLLLYLIWFWRRNRRSVIRLVLTVLAVNAFWLLPNLYFLLSRNAANVPLAKINEIFSEEAFLTNKSFGNIQNALLLKNYLLDWPAYQGGGSFGYAMNVWRSFSDFWWVRVIGYLFAAIAGVGLISSIKSRQRLAIGLIGPFLLSFLFLISDSFPISWLFGFLRDHSSIFKEAIRFPFTKFSILLMFTMSCYFAMGQRVIGQFLSKIKYSYLIQLVLVMVCLVTYMFPVFQGQLISKYVQVKIPTEYFQLFKWFDQQPDGRVADFPVNSLWGWEYYDWGFQGAQFISFGIKQPLLNRDYDRWNSANEEYYRQVSYAVYSNDLQLLESTLAQYKVKYILLDESLINPGNDATANDLMYYPQIKHLFGQSQLITKVWQQGKLSVYQFSASPDKDWGVINSFQDQYAPKGPAEANVGYLEHGNYISATKADLISDNYPLASISDNLNLLRPDLVNVKDGVMNLSFKYLPREAKLSLNTYLDNESQIPVGIFYDKTKQVVHLVYSLPELNKSDAQPTVVSDQISIPTTLANGFILGVNNQYVLNYNGNDQVYSNSDPTSIFLGNVFVNTQQDNLLNFYDLTPLIANNLNTSIDLSRQYVGLCSDPKQGQEFNSVLRVNQTVAYIDAKLADACVRLPLKQLNSQVTGFGNLIHLKFKMISPPEIGGEYCIWDKLANRCIKEQKFIQNGALVDSYIVLDQSIDDYELVLTNPANNENTLRSVGFGDLSVEFYQPVNEQRLSLSNLKQQLSESQIDIKPNDQITVTLPAYLNIDQPNILAENYKSSFCSNLVPKAFNRQVNQEQKYVEYSSIGGSSCDFFSFPTLSHQSGYVLTMKVQTLNGLPLRMCVANPVSKRCDVYTSLPSSNNFQAVSILVPPINDGGYGYNVHFDNYSIGDIPTVNRIQDLALTPLPYKWTTGLEFQDQTLVKLPGKTTIDNIRGPWMGVSIFEYRNEGDGESVITNNQSFDNGWVVLGKRHVWVNSWENGWVIKGGESGTAVMFYWPQFLELIGFGLLVVWVGIVKRQS